MPALRQRSAQGRPDLNLGRFGRLRGPAFPTPPRMTPAAWRGAAAPSPAPHVWRAALLFPDIYSGKICVTPCAAIYKNKTALVELLAQASAREPIMCTKTVDNRSFCPIPEPPISAPLPPVSALTAPALGMRQTTIPELHNHNYRGLLHVRRGNPPPAALCRPCRGGCPHAQRATCW